MRVRRRVVVRQRALAFEALRAACSTPTADPRSTVTFELRLPLVLDEERTSPTCLRARLVDDLQVALNGVRPVEQERGERIRDAAVDAGCSAGSRRARRVEGEAAARTAGILRLQQHVAVVPPLAAKLHRVRAHQLGQRAGDVPGLLRPIPRLAGREAEQRIAVAADADLRERRW